jgi:ParB family chromosome partitioning protein
MMKKRGLGRGLDALLGATKPSVSVGSKVEVDHFHGVPEGELREVPVDLIHRGKYQPRIDMHPESLEDLANSIKAQGVVQPILIRPIGDNHFEIIAGERRWRATQLAGLATIPAIIRNVPDEAAIAMALIENIQRQELNPIEESMAIQRLIDEFDMTHQEAADAIGRSRVAVTNLLRLLTLSDEVKRMVSTGELEMGHARALLPLDGPHQIQAARIVAAKNLSVRETERLARRLIEKKDEHQQTQSKPDPNVHRLEEEVSAKLGAKVKIAHGDRGRGKLEIHYNSLDELDGILAHIK